MQVPGVSTGNMGIGNVLSEMGAFLDDCERRGCSVERVDFDEISGPEPGGLRADVELRRSVEGHGDSFADPQVGADGTVRFALDSTTELVPVTEHDVRVEATAGAYTDGVLTVRFAAVVPGTGTDSPERETADPASAATPTAAADSAESGTVDTESPGGRADALVASVDPDGGTDRVDPESVDGAEGASAVGETPPAGEDGASMRDRDVPPFRDPELLATVYESCETFAEMAEALEMDVTAETVRRYMIDYDIHEPNSYQTSGGATEETATDQVALSDGIGLPDDVTVDDLVETVERSNTIYEVTQDIDIGRHDALEMLQDLNLLDLVVGRLATEGERDITREDIVDRLREASAVQ